MPGLDRAPRGGWAWARWLARVAPGLLLVALFGVGTPPTRARAERASEVDGVRPPRLCGARAVERPDSRAPPRHLIAAGDRLWAVWPSRPVWPLVWVTAAAELPATVEALPGGTWAVRAPAWPEASPPTSTGPFELRLEARPWGLPGGAVVGRWAARGAVAPGPDLELAAALTLARSAPPPQARAPEAEAPEAEAPAAMEAALTAALARAGGDPLRAAQVRVERARHAADRGGPAAGAAAWRANAEAAQALPSEAMRAWFAAAYMYLQVNALDAAEAAIEAGAAAAARGDLCGGEATAARYRGTIATRLGRLRAAEPAFLEAERRAEAEGLAELAEYARVNRAQLLSLVGRHREALALFAQVPARPGLPGAARAVNLGWSALLAHASGAVRVDLAAVRRLLTAGADTFAALAQPRRAANTWINLAYTAWLAEDAAAAQAALARARALAPSRGEAGSADYDGLFADLLAAQLALEAGDTAAARATFAAVVETAEARQSPEPAWRGHLGLARVALAEDRAGAALLALDEAQAWVEARARHAHLGSGQAQLIDERRELHGLRLALLLERGLAAEAFAAAEAAQARVLRALEAEVRVERLAPEARRRWTARVAEWLAARARFEAEAEAGELLDTAGRAAFRARRRAEAAALTARFDAAYAVLDEAAPLDDQPLEVAALQRALGPRGALLLFAPHAEGVGLFWLDAAGLSTAPLDGDPLAPWRARLEGVGGAAGIETLWVVTGGVPLAETLATARLPDGAPLLRQVGVRFLPAARALLARHPHPGTEPEPSTAEAAPPRALVVADPQHNLPAARPEGAQAAQALPGARLLEGDAASREAVLHALGSADLFHFAGHGVLAPDQPWEAHLALAHGQRLTLADLLVARPQVRTVVLSGCETGRGLDLSGQVAVGLPAAFLSAGARAVLATRRPIGDTEPAAFLARFYAVGGATRPGAAWRLAALASDAVGDRAWEAFVLIGPGE